MLSSLGRRRCCLRSEALVYLLLVLREHLQSLVDLGRQGLGRLQKVEEFPVVHLEEHAWVWVRAIIQHRHHDGMGGGGCVNAGSMPEFA